MFIRTHLALGLAAALYFLPHIAQNKFVFLFVVLLSSILPDLENGFVFVKRKKLFSLRKNMFSNKNWILHTYTFLIPTSIALTFFYPALAFPFFLGYSFHLFIDSFSPEGIRPFWPLKNKAAGKLAQGGKIDSMLFYILLIANLFFLVRFLA